MDGESNLDPVAGSHPVSGNSEPPSAPGVVGYVDRFKIIRPLGEGGEAQVLLACEPITDGYVAIKIIKPEYAAMKGAVGRFLTSGRHMYQMSHPSILKVLEVSDNPQRPYFVMPFVAEGSLSDRIKPGVMLPETMIVRVTRQIADALHYAHSKGIVHRDLKPDNILVDAENHAFLTDFGLIRTVFNDPEVHAQHREIAGTAPYMSPLIARGHAEDTRCDIYSLGAVLYQMLTGVPPYQGTDADDIIRQVLAGPPRPIRELNPNAPAKLVKIVEGAMARNLRDRYAQMSDIVRDLDRVATGQQPLGPHGRVRDVREIVVTVARLAVVGILAGIIWMVLRPKDPTDPPNPPPVPPLTPAVTNAEKEMTIDLGNGVTMVFVWISPGAFMMGSGGNEIGRQDDETRHEVRLSQGFWIGTHEVTQAQWDRVIGSNPSNFKNAGTNAPVELVTWSDCQDFLARLNAWGDHPKSKIGKFVFRLPTEAEWEYACRAGTKTRFASGYATSDLELAGWYHENAAGSTHPVGQKKPNAWGLYDMHGNVWEWCQDWYGSYANGAINDPEGPASGLARVVRGGAWYNEEYCSRSAFRYSYPPGDRYDFVGLRVVCVAR